ncbi:ABC transporter substrate-binding protein [Cloacibacillus sp. An23]|uniref:ABC transporter substrate-binding protein n=1 Tax=Cloacibacillus sp. An23 TaxID=1965591 RepID=UPI000B36C629|nr:ABC transporter substrate-binding protein [Cloacibacillus sp. An23]OUO93201.1 nitrate ABC transporter substrate-binding protein [Cloacibacillus sp. An23]
MKKLLSLMAAALVLAFAAPLFAGDVPVIRASYTMTTHQQAFMVAMAEGENFKDLGVWLKPVVPKEKFDLYDNGKKVARLEVVVTKSGSEATTLFAQGHLDLTTNSFPAMLSGIDSGAKIKVIAPLQSDAIAMVARNDIDVKGWDGFEKYVKESKRPVTVGYHSPTSAPKIVFEAAMAQSNLRVTGDANATKEQADIVMMDLKGIPNVIPAMVAKQVEFAVIPAPTPEVVEAKGQGHIVLQLKELPPAGEWADFPCCCIAASDKAIAEEPEALRSFVKLMTVSSEWCLANKEEAAKATGDWLGVEPEVISKAVMGLSTTVTPTWMKNASLYPDILNELGQLTGSLKGKKLADVQDQVFDFRFTKSAR